MSDFYHQFFCPENRSYSILIEDDGRVAYAYLLLRGDIIGDVWLYNRHKTPVVVDWGNREDLPFLNPQEFICNDNTAMTPIQTASQVSVEWAICDMELDNVKLYIHGRLLAVLKPNLAPGFSTIVCKDGPLARKWM